MTMNIYRYLKAVVPYAIVIILASIGIIMSVVLYISSEKSLSVISAIGLVDTQTIRKIDEIDIKPVYKQFIMNELVGQNRSINDLNTLNIKLFKARKIFALVHGFAWLLVFLIMVYLHQINHSHKKNRTATFQEKQ